MAVNQEVKSIVSEIKYKCGYNQSEIASELGIKNTYLSDVINGRVPFSDNLKNNIYETFSDRISWQIEEDDSFEAEENFLKTEREKYKMSLADISEKTNIPLKKLKEYDTGQKNIPKKHWRF